MLGLRRTFPPTDRQKPLLFLGNRCPAAVGDGLVGIPMIGKQLPLRPGKLAAARQSVRKVMICVELRIRGVRDVFRHFDRPNRCQQ